jgi:predicted lipoprotein with Yx(FWY)xxD motif
VTKALAVLVALACGAVAVAGCGSSDNSTTGSEAGYGGTAATTTAAQTAPAEATGTAVSAAMTKAGKVLVDSKGLTLYDFHKDKGIVSACYGACAKIWPPLLTEGKPQAGEGAVASKLGVTKRKDGTVQVTYARHPLYTFVEDTKPGEANGNDISDFGAQWYALFPSGEEAGD